MTRTLLLAAVCTLALTLGTLAEAGDWPHWRGPNYNGSASEDAAGLPTKFSRTEGVKWAADMPGPSAATPIVVGDKVFVSAADFSKMQLVAMCIDRATGKTLWSHEVHSGYSVAGAGNKLQLDDRSNFASPSPVFDGKTAVFFYGNGDLVAFDAAGKKLWAKNLQSEYGPFTFQWTFSASPTLHNGVLYMQVLQRDQPVHGRGEQNNPSFLLAMKPETGEVLWKVARPSKAKMESLESYATPIPHQRGDGKAELIIAGGDVLTGHDPETGAELWRWGTWNAAHREQWWRLVPSPVVGGGVVLIAAPKGAPVYAAKADLVGTHEGADGLAWKSADRSAQTSDVATPAFYDGDFFIVDGDKKKALSRVSPTGEVKWEKADLTRARIWGSPVAADGKVYTMDTDGVVRIFNAADGNLISTIEMGAGDEEIRSTIAIAGRNLFIRTGAKLYCIGE